MNEPDSYVDVFHRATGNVPHGYQRRVAEAAQLPPLIEVPPGYGKTAAIVIAWLWRRHLHPDPAVRTATPRRLIYALPQRSLVDQIAGQIETWLEALGLRDVVGLHVIMGGRSAGGKPWRGTPDAESILVGTIDMITSKALVRAYGTFRNSFPVDAAWMWNDCWWVLDEVQLAPASTTTLRQIDRFRTGEAYGPTGLTCMSATVPRRIIDTVDNTYPAESEIVRVGPDDTTEDLLRRRGATRVIRRVDVTQGNAKQLAAHAISRHRDGRLTLVIVNTVRMAREIEQALRRQKPTAEIVLLHSQFRTVERAPRVKTLLADHSDRIVVSTQVVEAGIDIDADVVITEVAPWDSIVQRSGRCNRAGLTQNAELWWTPAKPAPYAAADVDAAATHLAEFETQTVTNEQLLAAAPPAEPRRVLTLRRPDFESLFDTAPDLSGHDLDIAPYVRDTDDLSVQVAWAEWEDGRPGDRPPDGLRYPDQDWRCRVPTPAVSELIKAGKRVWRFDPADARWTLVDGRSPARPGEMLLIRAKDGGYDESVGFNPASTVAVTTGGFDAPIEIGAPEEDTAQGDTRSFDAEWVRLDQHLGETEEEARRLVDRLGLPSEYADDVVLAARVHDVGKAHPIWQDALCNAAAEVKRAEISEGRPWAKSASPHARLKYGQDVSSFRHELASVLLLDGPLRPLLDKAHDADLVRYLVMAHHGKLRVQVRDPKPNDDGSMYGLRSGDVFEVPAVLDVGPSHHTVSLARFDLSSAVESEDAVWADVVARLVGELGVFKLAYLEGLVRIADWRASARHGVVKERT